MMMLRFLLYNNLRKNGTHESLKSPHLLILNTRYYSKNVSSETLEKRRESVFSLFKSYGFSESQISTVFSKVPSLLGASPDKILKPKLDFLFSYGFPSPDINQILTSNPHILQYSLDKRLRPNIQFLHGVLKDNGTVISSVKRFNWILNEDLTKNLVPNMKLLRDYGVPDSRISAILYRKPRTFMHRPERVKAIIEEVKGMGFEPEKRNFVMAVEVISTLSKSTWEQKLKVYRKWGWSDDEIRLAFRKQPNCMASSKAKVERIMDFFVNKMGWDAKKVACFPYVFTYSLENWTIPRCLVVQFLLSKHVIDKDISLITVITPLEKIFLQRYVDKYSTAFPEVLTLYGRSRTDRKKL